MMLNIFTVLKNLPPELVYIILSYTYMPQSKLLTDDIKEYSNTKLIVNNWYYNRFVIELNEPEPSDKDWLINDLFAYTNRGFPTMNGYVEEFYNLFFKFQLLKTNEQVTRFILKIESLPVTTQINIFLGLFTLAEKRDFIKNLV